MNLTVGIAAVVVALSLIWIGGELHKGNCQRAGKVECSALPWSQGHAAQSGSLRGFKLPGH